MNQSSATPGSVHPSAGRPTHVRWKVMAFLCALSFLTYFDRFCIVQAQGAIQRDLGLSDGKFGLVLGAFWLAYALFEIPSGWLGDRYGARGTLVRIVLAWSLFTVLSGCAAGFVSLLAYRFLFGVGEAGAFPNMARVQGAWLPTHARARWGGLLWLMARWGAAASPLIVVAMLNWFDDPAFRQSAFGRLVRGAASWRVGFWVSGLLGLIWVLAFWPFFRDRPADKRSVNRAEIDLINAGRDPAALRAAGDSHRVPAGVFADLVRSRSLWAMAVLYLFVSFGWSFFASWIPRFFKDVHGLELKSSEWHTALPPFFGGISCLAGGALCDYLVRRTGRKRLFRALFPVTGYVIAATGFIAIRFARDDYHAAVICCVVAVAADFGQGANWSTIVDIGGRYAGIATGLINTIGNLGHFLQPVIGQAVFNHFGWNALFVVYAAIFLTGASMWLLIDPTRHFYRDDPAEARGFEVVAAT